MNPATHFLIGWSAANIGVLKNRRDRALVVVASIAPDFDGLGIVAEKLTAGSDTPLLWWSSYHHVLGHNLVYSAALSVLFGVAAIRKLRVALVAFVALHLHLIGDFIGGRGPDGFDWPIRYFYPFHDAAFAWKHMWALNAWPNIALTLALLALTLYWAVTLGRTPLEFVSVKTDEAVVATLRKRFSPERKAH